MMSEYVQCVKPKLGKAFVTVSVSVNIPCSKLPLPLQNTSMHVTRQMFVTHF